MYCVCLKGCIDPDSSVWLVFSLASLVSLTFSDVNALYFFTLTFVVSTWFSSEAFVPIVDGTGVSCTL